MENIPVMMELYTLENERMISSKEKELNNDLMELNLQELIGIVSYLKLKKELLFLKC